MRSIEVLLHMTWTRIKDPCKAESKLRQASQP